MTLFDIIVLAIALAMDAFAVAVCKGLALKKATLGQALLVGVWFGGFQALMPAIGYLLGSAFSSFIEAFVPWIAFVLLSLIGGNMLKEAFEKDNECECACDLATGECSNASLTIRAMFPLAVATSIDALATGVTFVLLSPWRVLLAVLSIGVITCALSAVGCKLGAVFGEKYRKKAVLFGGIVLVLLGIKILVSSFLPATN